MKKKYALWIVLFCLTGVLRAQQEGIVITGTVVDVSGCDPLAKNGSIEIQIEGGEEPYTFQWEKVGAGILTDEQTPMISHLDIGRYLVTVFYNDGLDHESREFTITATDAVMSSAVPQDVLCKGEQTGKITVGAITGISQLSYFLLNEDKTINSNLTGTNSVTFSDLPADTYHTVAKNDVSSCTDTQTVVIREPAEYLTLSAVQSRLVTCAIGNDGIVVVTISGGVGKYSLHILDSNHMVIKSAKDLEAGTHVFDGLKTDSRTSVIISDANNCTVSMYLDVREMHPPEMLEPEIEDIKCFNDKGAITIHAVPYNDDGNDNIIMYYWINGKVSLQDTVYGGNNKFTDLNGDIYALSAQDKYGCIGVKEVVLPEPESPVELLYDQGKLELPYGNVPGSITLAATGGWGSYTIECIRIESIYYQTIVEIRTNLPAGDHKFAGLEAGEYKFTIKDIADCGMHRLIQLDTATGESDLETADVKFFPNPSSDGKFIIDWGSGENRQVTLELYNIAGQMIYKTQAQTGSHTTVDMSDQSSGIYLLHVPELNIKQKLVIH